MAREGWSRSLGKPVSHNSKGGSRFAVKWIQSVLRSRAMTAVHDDGRALVDRLAKVIGTRVLAGEIPIRRRGSGRRRWRASSASAARPCGRRCGCCRRPASSRCTRTAGAVVRRPAVREVREAYEVRAELEGLAAAARRRARGGAAAARAPRGGGALPKLVRDSDRAPRASRRRHSVGRRDQRVDAGQRRLPRGGARCGRQRAAPPDDRRAPPQLPAQPDVDRPQRQLAAPRRERRAARAILAAIERGDGDDARRLMVEHIRRSGELVTLRFEQDDGGYAGRSARARSLSRH